MKKSVFKNKYVLGEGYPWAMGINSHFEISLKELPIGGLMIPLIFPKELWSKDIPKYRLVLERVEVGK